MSEQDTQDTQVAQFTAALGPIQRQIGYRPARWRWIEGTPDTVFEGFRVEVRSNLLGAEIAVLEADQTLYDLYHLMAPWVRDWNYEIAVEGTVEEPAVLDEEGAEIVVARTRPCVTYETLTPPAQGGWEIFKRVDGMTMLFIKTWLGKSPYRIISATSGEETPEGNSSGRASNTAAGTPDSSSPTTSTKKSRSTRASSRKPAPST